MLVKIIYRCLLAGLLICVSITGFAQVEVVTPQLIDQYDLNLTDQTPDQFELLLGSDDLISQGYNVTIGALYLLDNVNKSVELISKTLSGDPVVLETQINSSPYPHRITLRAVKPYQASEDFKKIVYVSTNNKIVSDDEADTYDVFIVDRFNQQTTRIQGNQPHQGNIYDVKISPAGNAIAFESEDWNFGDSSAITGYRVGAEDIFYVFNLETSQLTTPTIEKIFNGRGGDSDIFLSGDVVFSRDGQKLLFIVQEVENLDPYTIWYHKFHIYNLASNLTTRVKDQMGNDYLQSHGSQTQSRFLDDSHIVYSYSEAGSSFKTIVFNFVSETVITVPTGQWEVQDGQSTNGRYATFFDLPLGTNQYPDPYTNIVDLKSGDIWVLDLYTEKLIQAFSVKRFAKASVADFGVNFTECAFFYVANSDFNQYWPEVDPVSLCHETVTANINEYIQSSVDAYDLSPSDIKFHNNNQYITFEANSWYLDDSKSFEDFTPQLYIETLPPQHQSIVERPYARETFVVKNPFVDNTTNLIGEPAVDRYSESGVYLWQDNSGTTYLRAFAGGSAQGGASTRFAGTITSGSVITSLTPLSLESGSATPDTLTQVASNQVDFELFVVKPYRDDFTFVADPGTSLCVNLSDYAGGLFLGPDKAEVTPPYDIHSMLGCDNPSVEVDGAPVIDGAADIGWFIWRENGVWHNRFVAGGTKNRFQGRLTSTSAMTNLVPISIERSDFLGNLPSTTLSFGLTVRSPYRDGFSLEIDASASTCVSLEAPTGVRIYLGPDRLLMPREFDLSTLGACQGHPDIATLGKPNIDRTADKGIFLWERASNDWSAEVVTGDTRVKVIDIDVLSQQLLNNVVPVGIESNDVFTLLPQQLKLRLRVKAPWYDGFEFSTQAQSGTCVSTSSPALSIYLGPNRVEMGSSVNLDTQAGCQ